MPSHQRVGIFAVHVKAFAAGMRDGADRFLNHQAFFGNRQVDPAAGNLSGQPEVVAVGVVAEQRQHEAVFAARRSVTTAGVAAGPHEDRHHVQLEADRRRGGGVFHDHRQHDAVTGEFDFQFGRTIGRRIDEVRFEPSE